jgi:hypothetical protein
MWQIWTYHLTSRGRKTPKKNLPKKGPEGSVRRTYLEVSTICIHMLHGAFGEFVGEVKCVDGPFGAPSWSYLIVTWVWLKITSSRLG